MPSSWFLSPLSQVPPPLLVSTDKGLTVGLVVGVFTVVGTVIAALVVGLTAAFLAIIAGITGVFAITSRTIVKIVSLPFRPCLRGQDPISPLGTSLLILSQ